MTGLTPEQAGALLSLSPPEEAAPTRDEEVLARARALVRAHAVTPEQARLLELPLEGVRAHLRQRGAGAFLGCVHLPLTVYAAIQQGDGAPALPLTVALTLLHAGIDVLDDMMDGDLAAAWAAYRPAEILLAATTLIAALPPLALAEVNAPPTVVLALQRALARSALVMSAGQQYDVATAGAADPDAAAVELSVSRKSGEALALAAELAALLAGAPPEIVGHYAAMGRAYGTAAQIRSDIVDLFVAAHSRDLASGTRTLPVARYLHTLPVADRRPFLALLDKARVSPLARARVRRRLRAAGMARECAVIVELYCQAAYDSLSKCGASGPAAAALHGMIATCSLFDPSSNEGGGTEA